MARWTFQTFRAVPRIAPSLASILLIVGKDNPVDLAKVSDEWVVPLCVTHHREVQARGSERTPRASQAQAKLFSGNIQGLYVCSNQHFHLIALTRRVFRYMMFLNDI